MEKDSEIFFDKPCSVCGKIIKKDVYNQGECQSCTWFNNKVADENPDAVVYPNLVSLNKAKLLYAEWKSFRPSLEDFLDAFNNYGEMEFKYKDLYCALFRGKNNEGIEFGWNPKNIYYFSDKEDFIQNAKIGEEFVRDIWDKVENPKYM